VVFAAYHLPVTPYAPGLAAKLSFGLVLSALRQPTDSLVPLRSPISASGT
jgi:hypothetical protein